MYCFVYHWLVVEFYLLNAVAVYLVNQVAVLY